MFLRAIILILLLFIADSIKAQKVHKTVTRGSILLPQKRKKKDEKAVAIVSNPDIPIEAPGPVTKADFAVDDSEASAVYLLNQGTTAIEYNYDMREMTSVTKKFYRIKVLTNEGVDLGDYKIRLYKEGKAAREQEHLKELKAATYNLDEETGQIEVSLLDQEQIFRTEVRENVDEVSFALPNVKVNTIIQVSYEVESPFITRLDDWYFQQDYPVKKSSYLFYVYASVRYAFALQGHEQFSNGKTNDDRGMTSLGRLRPYYREWWYAEDIPAYRDEPFTSTREDHVSKLSLQLESTPTRTFLKSWSDVTQDLQGSKKFEAFYAGEKDFLTDDIPQGAPSYAKAKFIFEDFKKNYTWDGNYGVYPNVSFKELIGKKAGNTSSLGLALFQILKQAGYQVEPVLLSPRENGKINYSYPFIDNLIATVVRLTMDGKVYLLDPVHDVPFGFLHKSFLNEKGLVLSDEVEWQELTLGLKDYKTSQVSITVADDQIAATIDLNMKDYGVVTSGVDPVDLFKSDWEVSEVNMERNETTAQRLTAKIEREIEDDLILIPLSFDEVIFTENPFKAEKRLYSIDFLYSKQYSYKLDINLSDDYEFDSLPESRIVKTADGKLSALMNVNQLGQKLNVTFLFWTKTNSFDVAYYSPLQQAYELMEELAEGLIVVKRKP